MTLLIALTYSVAFAILFGIRNSYQFKENKAKTKAFKLKFNSLWHKWQAYLQGLFYSLIAIVVWTSSPFSTSILFDGLGVALIGAGLFWIIFDAIVNKYGLGKELLYVGETATLDKFYRNFKYPGVVMLISKALVVLAGITLTLI